MQYQEKQEGSGKRGDFLLERFWFARTFGRLVRPSASFLILASLLGWPSVWFLTKIPVLWNYMDGFLQVSTKPGVANLLVWPPSSRASVLFTQRFIRLVVNLGA
jgi:hypothetical protein